jgi:uncharacterized protein
MLFIMRKTLALILALTVQNLHADSRLRALIIDGQNNHNAWPKTTIMMRDYLEKSGRFKVDVARTKYTWKGDRYREYLALANTAKSKELKAPRHDPDFKPDFAAYDVVINNFGCNAAEWPKTTKKAFEEYMRGGGGMVVVHAANNCFPKWHEYNRMIGLGGWGGRNAAHGPYVYYNNAGAVVRDPAPGRCGAHGKRSEFLITMRNLSHPVTRGLPREWRTSLDECYSFLRGPAENMTILATACDRDELRQAGRHEPMLMTIEYGKGRIFHTCLGHDDRSCEGIGFIVTLLRGTEWAACGQVTIPVPSDFPDSEQTAYRNWQDPLRNTK